jgi:hypothetical protein
MLKQTLLSIMLVATTATAPLVNGKSLGVVATSPTASQEVASAMTSFSDDVHAVSAALTALATETDSTAGNAGNNTNQLITTFTPDVLSGFQAIINDPSPQTANSQVQQISAIR